MKFFILRKAGSGAILPTIETGATTNISRSLRFQAFKDGARRKLLRQQSNSPRHSQSRRNTISTSPGRGEPVASGSGESYPTREVSNPRPPNESALAIPTTIPPVEESSRSQSNEAPPTSPEDATNYTAPAPTADAPAQPPTAASTGVQDEHQSSSATPTGRQPSIPLATAEARPQPTQNAGEIEYIPPAGYPALAHRMGRMPEASIFRRFTNLNIQNVLYMQAELVCLEEELHSYQVEDAGVDESDSSDQRWTYACNWYNLSTSAEKETGVIKDPKQWHTIKEIRGKLRIYNEALIQLMTILSTSQPDKYDLRDIQDFIVSRDMKNGKAIHGTEAWIWGRNVKGDYKGPSADLLTVVPRQDADGLTRFVTYWAVKAIRPFKDKTVSRCTFVLTSAVASMLPVMSMLALQHVEGVQVRRLSLILIAVFNFALVILLTALASVRRFEVFAVASAFAAVNVVFITK